MKSSRSVSESSRRSLEPKQGMRCFLTIRVASISVDGLNVGVQLASHRSSSASQRSGFFPSSSKRTRPAARSLRLRFSTIRSSRRLSAADGPTRRFRRSSPRQVRRTARVSSRVKPSGSAIRPHSTLATAKMAPSQCGGLLPVPRCLVRQSRCSRTRERPTSITGVQRNLLCTPVHPTAGYRWCGFTRKRALMSQPAPVLSRISTWYSYEAAAAAGSTAGPKSIASA